MKFKSFFQRRPAAASLAESESPTSSTSVAAATPKRKKSDPKKILSTTMKSAKSPTLIAIPRGDKLSPTCSSSGPSSPVIGNDLNGTTRPQPPTEEIHTSRNNSTFCQTCGSGRELEIVEDLKMKQPSGTSFPNEERMSIDQVKEELENKVILLMKAEAKNKELTMDLEQAKQDILAKDKENEQMRQDFLLCIRSADRFREEAESKARALEAELVTLKEKLAEKEETKVRDPEVEKAPALGSVIQTTCEAPRKVPLIISELLNREKVVSTPTKGESKQVKKLASVVGQVMDLQKGEEDMDENQNRMRNEKLDSLRKNHRGSLRNALLSWCKSRTANYKNVEITNFSTSWSNGLALAALIHSLDPTQFNYFSLTPTRAMYNFKTALTAAEKLGVKANLNGLNQIVDTENPPWEPIFAYVSEIYVFAS